KVTKELNSIKQYSEGLRAQTHEFSNKVHTLYGLLQLQHHQAAKEFIEEEVNTSSHYYPSLREYIKDPVIQGLLIAKYNIANEKYNMSEIDDIRTVISKEIIPNIFDDGITTKTAKDHGKGMYMIKQALDSINGSIMLEDSELAGTFFIALIPKEEQDL